VKTAKNNRQVKKKLIVFVLTLIFAIAYIVLGSKIATDNSSFYANKDEDTVKAKVVSITKSESSEIELSSSEVQITEWIYFRAEILSGEKKGSNVVVSQVIDPNYYPVQQKVEVGDKVLIYPSANSNGFATESPWTMLEYLRSDNLIVLFVLFAVALIVFGKFKGFTALISLLFTCLSVFAVFVPAVLNGKNIYLWAMFTCLYIIVMTMLFINGISAKSLAAGAGCLSGVIMSGVLTVIMDKVLLLTGMVDEDTLYLQLLDTVNPIDLKGIVFAAIIIGAVGAIMDVSMDISSALNELRINSPQLSKKSLINSGLNIGRDVMGTMANTLVLAYIGSDLCLTLLLVAYNKSVLELFNLESIVVEVLQALAGSFGMLLTIPLTSLICAALYFKKTPLSERTIMEIAED